MDNETNIIRDFFHYKDSEFAEDEAATFFDQVNRIDIEKFLYYIDTYYKPEAIESYDIPQLSKFEVVVEDLPRILKESSHPMGFAEMGEHLLKKDATKLAYQKYGENHLKMAKMLGLVSEVTKRKYELSPIGNIYLSSSDLEKTQYIVRALMRTKLIAKLLKLSIAEKVNLEFICYSLSRTTYRRRRPYIRRMIGYIGEYGPNISDRIENITYGG